MKFKFTLALAVVFAATLLAPQAEARGWSWFVSHIRAGDKCSGAHPTTYYGDGHHNADGSRFSPRGYSAASWDYPFGTVLRVTNSRNGESVNVVVKDRGPARFIYRLGVRLDLSLGAALAIHLGQNGRFESGYTCHSVVAMGSGGTVTASAERRHHHQSRGRRLRYASATSSSDYMARAGAGK